MNNSNFNPNFRYYDSIVSGINYDHNSIEAFQPSLEQPDYEEDPSGDLWQAMKSANKFESYTNFTETQLIDLWHIIQPYVFK